MLSRDKCPAAFLFSFVNTAPPPKSGEWVTGGFDIPVQGVSDDAPNLSNGERESAPKPPARMSIVLPFIERDVPQVLRLLDHMAQLSGQLNRTLYLLPFKGLDVEEITKAARKAFADVQLITDSEGVTSDWRVDDKIRDAAGPNSLFRQAAWFFHFKRELGPWLYLEPDCVPLAKDWDAQLETAYRASGKSFLGVSMKWNGAAYLNGAAIYPQNTIGIAPALVTRAMWLEFPEKEIAFDIAGGASVLKNAAVSNLIQLEYRSENPKPRAGAVLFHGDHQGKLFQTLSATAPRPGSENKRAVKTRTRRAQNISKRKRVPAPVIGIVPESSSKINPKFFEVNLNGSTPTVGDQIRAGVQTLVALASNANRKTRIRAELRKTNLLPQAAKKLCT